MKLTQVDLKILCDLATAAAEEAGQMIESFDVNQLTITQKETGSTLRSQVVTEVDRLSEKHILKRLQSSLAKYDLGILTEESLDDGSRFEKDYFWCIDPLDGTLAYIRNEPGYSISIAVVSREGESVLGVVYDPRNKNLFQAYEEGGASLNGSRIVLKPHQDNSSEVTQIDFGGAVMSACQALLCPPAVFVKYPKDKEGGGCLWDYAATACIYQELGAWVSDVYGQPLQLNAQETVFLNGCGVLYATHPDIASLYIR